jgi:hypothetical protein
MMQNFFKKYRLAIGATLLGAAFSSLIMSVGYSYSNDKYMSDVHLAGSGIFTVISLTLFIAEKKES